MEKGSFEILEWLDTMGPYKCKLPIVVRQVYDFKMYRLVTNTCNDEQLYELHTNFIKDYGFTRGIQNFINKLKIERSREKEKKRKFIDEQLKQPKVTIEQLEDKIKAEDALKGMTEEERRKHDLREAPWTDKRNPGIWGIPLSIHQEQEVLEHKVDGDGVGYVIYDKVYQAYACFVYSPMRKKPDGTQGVTVLRSNDLDGIHRQLGIELDTEKKENKEWMEQNRNRQPDISHVRRIMNLDGESPSPSNGDLNGDIF